MSNFSFIKDDKQIQIDLQPCRKTIFFDIEGSKDSYFLSFPKIRIISSYREVRGQHLKFNRFLGSSRPLMAFFNKKQKIMIPPLPNINFGGDLCLKQKIETQKIEDLPRKIIECFFDSTFNASTIDQFEAFYPGPADLIDLLSGWEDQTKADQNWIPDDFIEWNPQTLHEKSMYNQFFGDQNNE